MADTEKPDTTMQETVAVEDGVPVGSPVYSEDEPTTVYDVQWRTLMAILALSMANCCAAVANTVRFRV